MTRDEARTLCLAWLRETMTALPGDVTSLSLVVEEDYDEEENPYLLPLLRAVAETDDGRRWYPDDYPNDALECIDALDDALRDATEPFLDALGVGYFTVKRADLATEGSAR